MYTICYTTPMKKNKQVNIRMTEKTKKKGEAQAKAFEMNLGEYVRYLINKGE